ncbi:MAG: rod shape-determining protein MreD [Candidatus Omnitrophica bacterium]|nr:rod shape-determining protein MreD [Candidatus Omnitrophota bacterium]
MLLLFSWLELTFLYDVSIVGARPLLLWLGVIFISIWEREIAGLVFGILAGLLADLSSSGHFGLNTICFGLGGYLTGSMWMKFVKESPLTQIVIAFLSSLFYLVLYCILTSFFHPIPSIGYGIKMVILPTVIYTTLIAVPLFRMLAKVYGILERRY